MYLSSVEVRRPSAEQKSSQTLRSGRRRWRSAALLAALVALGLGLAACGGGSPNASSNPASLAISGCSPSGCSSPGASASAEAMAVKFSGCMRSHGVTDFPDPTVGSNGLPSFGPLMRAMSTASHRRSGRLNRSARTTCPTSPHTSAEKAAANAAALKYATCMRSNGVPNFPDPNGQGLIQVNARPASTRARRRSRRPRRPARVWTTASVSSRASPARLVPAGRRGRRFVRHVCRLRSGSLSAAAGPRA